MPISIKGIGYDLPASGGGGPSPVSPPIPTAQVVVAGGSPSAKTFSSFTDPGSIISSYSAVVLNTVGTTSIASGSGLGPYSFSGFSNGDDYTLILTARDSGGNTVATAFHSVSINPSSIVDLTATNVSNPALYAANTASFGPVVVGSWSASVSVVATAFSSSGPTPTVSVSGSGSGPYSVSVTGGLGPGASYAVRLTGTAADGQVAGLTYSFATASSPSAAQVTPPATTTQAVAGGASPAAKTFGSFTDPNGVISSYSASISNAVGSTVIASGSGLGPYTFGSFSDGDSFSLALNALDASGQIVSTAFHSVNLGLVELLAPQNSVPFSYYSGTTALPSTSIGSWSASVSVVAVALGSNGATPTVVVSGSGAGPYTVSISSGLQNGVTYTVTATGTGVDGQTALASYSFGVSQVSTLQAPPNPNPVVLAAGSTALPSISLGSWSAAVTVQASAISSEDNSPEVTLTGTGAGPYSVSIASGLVDGETYTIVATGFDSLGQKASCFASFAVSEPSGVSLLAPPTPTPVVLPSGTTSLGTTLVGSWSAPVTVTAAAVGSDGSTPAVTLTGSGAGPYSVSIASGLSDGITYSVTLSGTDGVDTESVVLGVTVEVVTGWKKVIEYDYTQADTGSVITGTGTYNITRGGLPFQTVTAALTSGSAPCTFQAINGRGVRITGSSRSMAFSIDLRAFGIKPTSRWAVEVHVAQVVASTGYNMVISSGTSNAAGTANGVWYLGVSGNFGVRTQYSGTGIGGAFSTQGATPATQVRALLIQDGFWGVTAYGVPVLGGGIPETWGSPRYAASTTTPSATLATNPFIVVGGRGTSSGLTDISIRKIIIWQEIV